MRRSSPPAAKKMFCNVFGPRAAGIAPKRAFCNVFGPGRSKTHVLQCFRPKGGGLAGHLARFGFTYVFDPAVEAQVDENKTIQAGTKHLSPTNFNKSTLSGCACRSSLFTILLSQALEVCAQG